MPSWGLIKMGPRLSRFLVGMLSVVRNDAAQVALQTLQAIQAEKAEVAEMLITGKISATSEQNAAIWAVSKDINAELTAVLRTQTNLAVGQSTISVGRSGAESIVEVVRSLKDLAVAAQSEESDRGKLQTNFNALLDQIDGIVELASVNGVNVLRRDAETGLTNTVFIGAGTTEAESTSPGISVRGYDLSTNVNSVAAGSTALSATDGAISGLFAAGAAQAFAGAGMQTLTLSDTIASGTAFSVQISATSGDFSGLETSGTDDILFVADGPETAQGVAEGLAQLVSLHVEQAGFEDDALSIGNIVNGGASTTAEVSRTSTGTGGFSVTISQFSAQDTAAGGALGFLRKVDLTDENSLAFALEAAETATQVSVSAAAALGGAQTRLDTHLEFMDSLEGAIRSGLGSLTDVDLTELAARREALEVQSQLATQALQIANATPQALLQLLR